MEEILQSPPKDDLTWRQSVISVRGIPEVEEGSQETVSFQVSIGSNVVSQKSLDQLDTALSMDCDRYVLYKAIHPKNLASRKFYINTMVILPYPQ